MRGNRPWRLAARALDARRMPLMNPAPCPTSPQAEPSLPTSADEPLLRWQEGGVEHVARWRSEAGLPPPRRVEVVDATLKADVAYRLACSGTAMLWRGDFSPTRASCSRPSPAAATKWEVKAGDKARGKAARAAPVFPEAFNLAPHAPGAAGARTWATAHSREAGHRIPLRRAPDIVQAATEAYGQCVYVPCCASCKASSVRTSGARTGSRSRPRRPHPPALRRVRRCAANTSISSPRRRAPAALAETNLAFDIGCGTGVLAAVLARRGVARIIATDQEARAPACARDNVDRLGIGGRSSFRPPIHPPGRAALVVCAGCRASPARASSTPSMTSTAACSRLSRRALRAPLAGRRGLADPVRSGRTPAARARGTGALIEAAGLQVVGRLTARPLHPARQRPGRPAACRPCGRADLALARAKAPGPAPGP